MDGCSAALHEYKIPPKDLLRLHSYCPVYFDAFHYVIVDTKCSHQSTKSSYRTTRQKVGELKKLVEEGNMKYIGLSEVSPDMIRRAHVVHPITTVQIEWSLWTCGIEDEIVPSLQFVLIQRAWYWNYTISSYWSWFFRWQKSSGYTMEILRRCALVPS